MDATNVFLDIKLFDPSIHNTLAIILDDVEFGNGLRAVVHDSDPYDCISYHLNGIPMATEYVGDFKKRFNDIRADIDTFINILKNFRN